MLALAFLVVVALAVIAAGAAIGVAFVAGRRIAALDEHARRLERDIELERIRAESAIAALNAARRALAEVTTTGDSDARELAENGLLESVLGSTPQAIADEARRG